MDQAIHWSPTASPRSPDTAHLVAIQATGQVTDLSFFVGSDLGMSCIKTLLLAARGMIG